MSPTVRGFRVEFGCWCKRIYIVQITLRELAGTRTDELLKARYEKFRKLGEYTAEDRQHGLSRYPAKRHGFGGELPESVGGPGGHG